MIEAVEVEYLYGIKLESPRIKKWKFALFLQAASLSATIRRLHIEGGIPEEGSALLVSNHLSYIDPILYYWVAATTARRSIRMLAKDTIVDSALEENPKELARTNKEPTPKALRYLLSFCANIGDPISINRTNPNPSTFRAIDKVLKDEQIIGIFLQETRKPEKDLLDVREGVAYISKRNPKVPIYPMGISGSQLDLKHLFGPIDVKIDKPLNPLQLGLNPKDKNYTSILTQILTDKVANLIPDDLKKHWLLNHS